MITAMEFVRRLAQQAPTLGGTQALSSTTTVAGFAQRIQALFDIDQFWRKATMHPSVQRLAPDMHAQVVSLLRERFAQCDREHTRELGRWVNKHGWPLISVFGKAACHRAWLLAQHADADVDFQCRVLGLMEALFDDDEVAKADYAYLHDRVAVAQERPQRYGTQGHCPVPGAWVPRELEEPLKVDQWRASVGLGSMQEYTERMNAIAARSVPSK